MKHGRSKGTITYLVACWEFPIFLNAADCALLYPSTSFPPFVIGITVVMILRVYAMWNQSKRILWALLFIYAPQVIVSFVFTGIYDNLNTHLSGMSRVELHASLKSHAGGWRHLLASFSPVTVVQFLDLSFCTASLNNVPSLLIIYDAIPRFVLAVVLLALAVTQTLTQSIHMYKATKQWQPNQYIQQFVTDGILYFLV